LRPTALFARPVEAVGTGASVDQEAAVLDQLVAASANLPRYELADALEAFVNEHPDSVWAPGLRVNLARFYLTEGYYTKPLEH
jgi:hypothetical protein